MIYIGADPHTILSAAFEKCLIHGHKPVVVKSRFARLHSKIRAVRLVLICLAMPLMVLDIWVAALTRKPIVVREFWNLPLAAVCLLLWPLRHRIMFNINHNLSGLPQQFPASLRRMATMGFHFILFDGSDAAKQFPAEVLPAFHFPLFPCVVGSAARAPGSPPVLAVVGDFRAEKGDPVKIRTLIKTLAKDTRWTVHIGKHGNKAALFGNDEGITIVDTSSHADYLSFLSTADIVLVFADSTQYYVRHSGTVMDAIACGAVPIVPNLPVIASQVSNPDAVGITYSDLSDLEACVIKAISGREVFATNRPTYFDERQSVELMESISND